MNIQPVGPTYLPQQLEEPQERVAKKSVKASEIVQEAETENVTETIKESESSKSSEEMVAKKTLKPEVDDKNDCQNDGKTITLPLKTYQALIAKVEFLSNEILEQKKYYEYRDAKNDQFNAQIIHQNNMYQQQLVAQVQVQNATAAALIQAQNNNNNLKSSNTILKICGCICAAVSVGCLVYTFWPAAPVVVVKGSLATKGVVVAKSAVAAVTSEKAVLGSLALSAKFV